MQNLLLSNRIKSTCKERKIAIKTLLEKCNMNRNTIYDLEKKGSFPSIDKIIKIADYLDCSVDYLLGREDNSQRIGSTQSTVNTNTLRSDEEQLLKNYNKLNTDGKAKVQEYTKDLTGNKAYTGTNSLQGKLHA